MIGTLLKTKSLFESSFSPLFVHTCFFSIFNAFYGSLLISNTQMQVIILKGSSSKSKQRDTERCFWVKWEQWPETYTQEHARETSKLKSPRLIWYLKLCALIFTFYTKKQLVYNTWSVPHAYDVFFVVWYAWHHLVKQCSLVGQDSVSLKIHQ